MRSRADQPADGVALKPQKRKSTSKKRSSNHALAQSRWPKVAISRSADPRDEPGDAKRKLSRFGGCSIEANHTSDVIAYRDIVDLFCESSDASNEGRTTCPQISSSTELDEDSADVCSTCKDCAECQLQQQQQNTAKTEESLMNDHDEELVEHLDYYEGDISGEAASTPSTDASMEHEEVPILVDLTREESKQTILKQFDDAEESSEMSGENVITSAKAIYRLARLTLSIFYLAFTSKRARK